MSTRYGFPFRRRQHLGEVIRDGGEPRRDLAFGLLRLEQLVRNVQRRENRGLVRLHQRSLTQHLLQCLIKVGGDFARVVGRQVGANGVLLAPNHHPHGVLLHRHLCAPLSRACSSKNVRRCIKSCTRVRAPSIRWRSALFSDSSSGLRTGVPDAPPPPAPPRVPDFSSDSAFCARERHPASSSATSRTIASSWSIASRTSSGGLSPLYVKFILPRFQHPAE